MVLEDTAAQLTNKGPTNHDDNNHSNPDGNAFYILALLSLLF